MDRTATTETVSKYEFNKRTKALEADHEALRAARTMALPLMREWRAARVAYEAAGRPEYSAAPALCSRLTSSRWAAERALEAYAVARQAYRWSLARVQRAQPAFAPGWSEAARLRRKAR